MFRRLGAALEEAARVAGANTATMLWRITIPLLSPMILAVSVLSFISRSAIVQHRASARHPAGIYVYSTRIYDYIHREPSSYGEATALGSVFILTLGALLFLYWRFLQRQASNLPWSRAKVIRPCASSSASGAGVALAGCLFYIAVMTVLPLIFLIIGSFMRRYGFFNINLAVYLLRIGAIFSPIRLFS